MRTDFMASAKQIAWREKFAKMAKSGKFKKSKKSSNLDKAHAQKIIKMNIDQKEQLWRRWKEERNNNRIAFEKWFKTWQAMFKRGV